MNYNSYTCRKIYNTANFIQIVTFHAKTYNNDFPLNGWNERPSNGLQTGHEAVLNGFQWVFEWVIKYSERVA